MALLLLACVPIHHLTALFTRHKPMPRFFLGAVAWLAGVRVRQHGEKVHRGAFLLANHVSWIDVPAMAGATGTAFVAHDGLASLPLLKWLCQLNDTVFVARHDRASVAAQVAQVREAIRDTGALAIFPEGTTSDGTGLLAFKSSLLSALEPLPQGIAVQPVLLDYGPEAAEIAWVGEEHGLDNFLRILARRRPVRLDLHFLPVLSGDDVASRKTIAAAARAAMLDRLGA
jgi:1-acyl-sn-glycerol-3-phosphate acyltransferase